MLNKLQRNTMFKKSASKSIVRAKVSCKTSKVEASSATVIRWETKSETRVRDGVNRGEARHRNKLTDSWLACCRLSEQLTRRISHCEANPSLASCRDAKIRSPDNYSTGRRYRAGIDIGFDRSNARSFCFLHFVCH